MRKLIIHLEYLHTLDSTYWRIACPQTISSTKSCRISLYIKAHVTGIGRRLTVSRTSCSIYSAIRGTIQNTIVLKEEVWIHHPSIQIKSRQHRVHVIMKPQRQNLVYFLGIHCTSVITRANEQSDMCVRQKLSLSICYIKDLNKLQQRIPAYGTSTSPFRLWWFE